MTPVAHSSAVLAYDAYGSRTSRTVRSSAGETTEERRRYDRYGRLTEISSFGTSVKYRYDAKGRVSRQTIDGSPIDFAYTKYGQLAGKYLGGKEKPDATVEYEYSKSGQIVARTANGVRQTYEYDGRGQLLAVKENGVDVERYSYDKAGNMLRKTVRGKTTTFIFDGANQLVSSTTDGVTTRYAYDAAGRLVREGNKTYRYGYLDKVLSVTEGEQKYTYDYHVDGQLARADYGNGKAEDFGWDGLALIRRGDERFVNEPHIGGGNPVASSKGTTYFNDMLGTTVGAKTKGRKYTAAALTAFGETIENVSLHSPTPTHNSNSFYTGKPEVAGLGHAFLMRNYRASLAKWQTADPMGYPDGWNQLAYCKNSALTEVDLLGAATVNYNRQWTNFEFLNYYYASQSERIFGDMFDTDGMQLTSSIWNVIYDSVIPRVEDQIDAKVRQLVKNETRNSGTNGIGYGTYNTYDFKSACWALGDGVVSTSSSVTYTWWDDWVDGTRYRYYIWTTSTYINYSDVFMDPLNIRIESPFANAYSYYHTWEKVRLVGSGVIE